MARRRGKTDLRTQRSVLTDRGQKKFREALTLWRTAQEAFVSLYGGEGSKTVRAAALTIAHDDRLGTMAEHAT